MIVSRLVRLTFSTFAAVVMLSACTSSGSVPNTNGAATGPPLSRAAHADLLYVSGGCGGTCILSYPKGKPVGSLAVSGASLCSDKNGNVFVPTTDGSGHAVVYEFAHGGTQPIATLTVDGILAEGCSVDPSSGNLAVTYLCHNCDYGPVDVFANAQGSPKTYFKSGVFLSYCGYDDKGNLFADGASSGFALLELPSGGSSLEPISVSQSISTAGAVQWDGSNLAIEDISHPAIYRFSVSGSTATLAGTTTLKNAGSFVAQSWIQGKNVIVPFGGASYSAEYVGFWKYPKGGDAKKVLKKHLDATAISGVTVSTASM